MLELLRIRNLALIEDMALDFGEGMNVLTGETGAGKSFILKALGFLLGERLSPDMVRPGSDRAQVEAVFAGKDGGELILRRELFASGRSRFFVNDSPKPQERARELKDSLVAYTSQHGQQKLLQPAYQNQIMEQTIDCPELLQERDRLRAQLEAKLEERRAIEARQASLAEMRDLLELRQAEIDKVKPQENEDEELEALRVRARQAQEAARDYDQALGYLYGDADAPGLLDMARTFHRHLERMAKADAGLEPSCEATGSFVQELQHLAGRLRQPPRLEDMPPDMDAVEERLFELSQLKRRLRRTLPQILALKDEIAEKISFLDQCALDIKRLQREEDALAGRLKTCLEQLLPRRRACCDAFAARLEAQLRGLGFSEEVRVIPRYAPSEIWPGIADEKVRLLWAPNPGQPPQPLDRIASGGELSRFLLALAGVLPSAEEATFIFDEVDSGVGGLTLNRLADRLEQLACSRQMLLVTHWPQIASRAGRHFQITKTVREGKTFTLCTPLNDQERHDELARMAGGGAQGEAMADALDGAGGVRGREACGAPEQTGPDQAGPIPAHAGARPVKAAQAADAADAAKAAPAEAPRAKTSTAKTSKHRTGKARARTSAQDPQGCAHEAHAGGACGDAEEAPADGSPEGRTAEARPLG